MRPLPNYSGSISYGSTPSKVGSSESTAASKQFFQDLVKRADAIPIATVFRHYGLLVSSKNRKITCPFPKHQGGHENTPSFMYYPDTNSFWCFGCKTGRSGTDFVANMENISRAKAAFRILSWYASSDPLTDIEEDPINYSERLQIMMVFSNLIREFMVSNLDDPAAIEYAEKITRIFDKMLEKHSLNNDAVKIMIDNLKTKMELYRL